MAGNVRCTRSNWVAGAPAPLGFLPVRSSWSSVRPSDCVLRATRDRENRMKTASFPPGRGTTTLSIKTNEMSISATLTALRFRCLFVIKLDKKVKKGPVWERLELLVPNHAAVMQFCSSKSAKSSVTGRLTDHPAPVRPTLTPTRRLAAYLSAKIALARPYFRFVLLNGRSFSPGHRNKTEKRMQKQV